MIHRIANTVNLCATRCQKKKMILGASLMAVFLHKTCPIIRTLRFQYKIVLTGDDANWGLSQKRRQGAQPEMESLFKGHGDFPIKQKERRSASPLLWNAVYGGLEALLATMCLTMMYPQVRFTALAASPIPAEKRPCQVRGRDQHENNAKDQFCHATLHCEL